MDGHAAATRAHAAVGALTSHQDGASATVFTLNRRMNSRGGCGSTLPDVGRLTSLPHAGGLATLPHLGRLTPLPHLRRLSSLPNLRWLPAAGLGRGRAVAALHLVLLESALLGPAIVDDGHRGRESDVEEDCEKERKEHKEDTALHLAGVKVLSSRGGRSFGLGTSTRNARTARGVTVERRTTLPQEGQDRGGRVI